VLVQIFEMEDATGKSPDGGCYREESRQEVLMEYEARKSVILMFNSSPAPLLGSVATC